MQLKLFALVGLQLAATFSNKKTQTEHCKQPTAHIFAGMTPAEINLKWSMLQQRIAEDFDNEKPDLKVMLFLIGVQELGQGPRKFSKRQKEELMHIANCKLFSMMGFYELEGLDQDGWPHWKRVGVIPNYTLLEQEMVLKSLMIDYFEGMENNE